LNAYSEFFEERNTSAYNLPKDDFHPIHAIEQFFFEFSIISRHLF